MDDFRTAVVEALVDEQGMHAVDAEAVAETVMEVAADWIARGQLQFTDAPA